MTFDLGRLLHAHNVCVRLAEFYRILISMEASVDAVELIRRNVAQQALEAAHRVADSAAELLAAVERLHADAAGEVVGEELAARQDHEVAGGEEVRQV